MIELFPFRVFSVVHGAIYAPLSRETANGVK